jgi:hypothetical protein
LFNFTEVIEFSFSLSGLYDKIFNCGFFCQTSPSGKDISIRASNWPRIFDGISDLNTVRALLPGGRIFDKITVKGIKMSLAEQNWSSPNYTSWQNGAEHRPDIFLL